MLLESMAFRSFAFCIVHFALRDLIFIFLPEPTRRSGAHGNADLRLRRGRSLQRWLHQL
jgi:hypothetical protein